MNKYLALFLGIIAGFATFLLVAFLLMKTYGEEITNAIVDLP